MEVQCASRVILAQCNCATTSCLLFLISLIEPCLQGIVCYCNVYSLSVDLIARILIGDSNLVYVIESGSCLVIWVFKINNLCPRLLTVSSRYRCAKVGGISSTNCVGSGSAICSYKLFKSITQHTFRPAALNEIVSASETLKFVVPVFAAAVLVAVSVTVNAICSVTDSEPTV